MAEKMLSLSEAVDVGCRVEIREKRATTPSGQIEKNGQQQFEVKIVPRNPRAHREFLAYWERVASTE